MKEKHMQFGLTHPATIVVPDPLEPDHSGDEPVVTTRRALCRIALVASETAVRFEREGVPYDPMAWMLAPRRMFDGRAALDACLGVDACVRAVVAHGLSLDLDQDRGTIEGLMAFGRGSGSPVTGAAAGACRDLVS